MAIPVIMIMIMMRMRMMMVLMIAAIPVIMIMIMIKTMMRMMLVLMLVAIPVMITMMTRMRIPMMMIRDQQNQKITILVKNVFVPWNTEAHKMSQERKKWHEMKLISWEAGVEGGVEM